MVDGVGTNKYTYFAGGQLQSEDGPWANDTVTNGYVNSLRTSLGLQQPTGNWTNGFGYDSAKRLTNVTSQAGSFGYGYTNVGQGGLAGVLIRKLSLPNGAYITNVFDSVARLLTNSLRNSSDAVLDSYAYIYNPANQRTNLTRADASYYGFVYDKIGQLTVADSTVNTEDRGYFYDAAWNLNRRTNNGVVSTFNVDGDNQLTTEQCRDAYDFNGNLITRGECQGAYSCSYDDENRLISLSSGTVYRSDFSYDGLGRVRVRTDYTWNSGSWVVSATIRYIYDGNRVIQERNSSNTPTVAYTRGSDLSRSLEGAGGIGGLLARSDGYSAGNWTNHNYYFADGNGNVTYMINSSQAMVASYRYDPYGNTISSSGSLSAANVYRFSSKEIHVNSGMYYYLYRFYDPNLQRWINRDPFGERGFEVLRRGAPYSRGSTGPNLYTFVRNNPNSALDPFGLSLWICSTPAFGIYGINHVYMWDDSDNPKYEKNPCGRGCAMQKSSGSGGTQEGNCTGPPGGLGDGFDNWDGKDEKGLPVSCQRVPNSNGKKGDDAMDCCNTTANNRAFLPPFSDCHSALDDCLKGFDIPSHPRTGYPYSP